MANGFVQRFKGKIVGEAGSLFRFGKGGQQFSPAGQIFNYLSATGTGNGADTTEDLLQSFSLPANCLDIAGRGLVIQAWGTSAANTNSKTARLYFGTSIVLSSGAFTTSGAAWMLELDVWKVSSNVQIANGQPIVGATHGGVQVFDAGAETDTAAITIKATGQTAVASANDVVLHGLSIFAMD